MEQNNKVWWKSKIIWLSVATIVVSASEYIAILEQYIPQHYQGMFTALTGILIVIARVYSNKELTTSNNHQIIESIKPRNNKPKSTTTKTTTRTTSRKPTTNRKK